MQHEPSTDQNRRKVPHAEVLSRVIVATEAAPQAPSGPGYCSSVPTGNA